MPVDGQKKLAVGKKLGDFILVLVANALGNASLHRRAFARLTIGALGLDHGQWNAVDEADNVRPAGLGQIRAQDAEFLGEGKAVVLRVLPVDQSDGRVGLVPVDELGNGNAEQQMRGHLVIGIAQTGDEVRMRDVGDQCVDGLIGQAVLLAFKREAPFFQFRPQEGVQHHGALPVAPQGECFGWGQEPPAECAEQGQCGQFGAVFFLKFRCRNHNVQISCKLKYLNRPSRGVCP
ncbi:hypothetical protein NBRC3279_2760 [Acetobacter pasteurianus NBRC 3279]|nr:hypothetical protein NBRC3279_2760 [Acetobacter pasteurianus NBRC 3279]GCD73581.1 hypothetical protein NBRC3284_2737 [Acetobacter pasteurianus NBRC 3284]